MYTLWGRGKVLIYFVGEDGKGGGGREYYYVPCVYWVLKSCKNISSQRTERCVFLPNSQCFQKGQNLALHLI